MTRWLVILLAAALAGCDDGGPGDADADADTDVDTDADADADGDADADADADGDADTDADADADADDDAPPAPLPPLPLRVDGRWIVDADGHRFKLASVNWYGAESKDFVVGGLDRRDLGELARLIASMGFNSVRLPWSNELVEDDPVVADAVVAANPALRGLHGLEVLDAVVAALAAEGIVVVLDNHVSRADWCCGEADGNGLWYSDEYPEWRWLADWDAMASRYLGQPAVVGAELRNEVRPASVPTGCSSCASCPCTAAGCTLRRPVWGGGDPLTDWRAAATLGAGVVLDANPDLIVFVGGLNYQQDLSGVWDEPIDLGPGRRDRLAYAVHDYSFFHTALIGQASPSYDEYRTLMGDRWGFVLIQDRAFTAPIWVSEFGTCHASVEGCVSAGTGPGWWFDAIGRYLAAADIDWAYWALNGTRMTGTCRTFGDEEGYGILDTTYTGAALPALLEALQALQPATQGP